MVYVRNFLVFLCAATLSACAFREPMAIDDARFHLTADWDAGPGGRPSEQVKALRDLVASSSSQFEAQGFITLPVVAPERLSVGIQVPEETAVEEPRFVRGSISVAGVQTVLPISLTGLERLDGVLRLELQVGGLRSLMPKASSARAQVSVEVFGATTRQFQFLFGLRTPPSQLERTSELSGVAVGAGQSKPTPGMVLNPRVYGRQFNLVRTFEFTNHEDWPVEVSVPRRVTGRFYQEVERWDWRDLGCPYGQEAPGIEDIRRPDSVTFSDQLYLLPLDGDLLIETEKSYWNPNEGEPMPRTIAPGQHLRIGLYAVGESADRWAAQGPLQTSIDRQVVPGRCRAECVDWHLPCPPRNPACLQANRLCLDWRHWRDNTTGARGFVSRLVYLDLGSTAPRLRFRFGDFGPSQDGEIREQKLAEGRFEVKWE